MWRHSRRAATILVVCLLAVSGGVFAAHLAHHSHVESRAVRILITCMCLVPAGTLFWLTERKELYWRRQSLAIAAVTIIVWAVVFYGLTMLWFLPIDRNNETVWTAVTLPIVFLVVSRVLRRFNNSALKTND